MNFPGKFICLMGLLMISAVAHPQERETASIAEIRASYDMAKAVTDDIADLRRNMGSEQGARLFLEGVVESQKRLEPIIIRIAETNSPKDAQVYAISVAIAVKEAELALWHYINAFLSNQQSYLQSADIFLRESIKELAKAYEMAPPTSQHNESAP